MRYASLTLIVLLMAALSFTLFTIGVLNIQITQAERLGRDSIQTTDACITALDACADERTRLLREIRIQEAIEKATAYCRG